MASWANHKKSRWQERASQFFGERAGGFAEKNVTLLQKKLANKHIVQALDHTLQMGAELSLCVFRPAQDNVVLGPDEEFYSVQMESLPDALRQDGVRTTRVCVLNKTDGVSRFAVFWNSPRRTVHFHTDQGSIGAPAKLWLLLTKHLRGWFWLDTSHRRHNGVTDTFAACGLSWVRREMGFLASVGTGPWLGAGHFGTMSEALREFTQNMTWQDPLFMELYPRIVASQCQGQLPLTYGTQAHMQEVFSSSGDSTVARNAGEKVKLGRWFRFSLRYRQLSPSLGVLLLALVYIGITRKWWKSVDDSPLRQRSGNNHGGDDDDALDPEGDPPRDSDDDEPPREPIADVATRAVATSSLSIEKN